MQLRAVGATPMIPLPWMPLLPPARPPLPAPSTLPHQDWSCPSADIASHRGVIRGHRGSHTKTGHAQALASCHTAGS
eukprot:3719633-Pyramimonas_sp.AAC.1